MASRSCVALGLDFGTESVRALLVGLDGKERAWATVRYKHGQILERLPGTGDRLPADFALQDPRDWINAMARATRRALRSAGLNGGEVISIGVDFTSCTMLPTRADGVPLCELPQFAGEKYAWPKLWKHHAAGSQTERINAVARGRKEPWLARYGGQVGLEWFFPKILETLEQASNVYDATDVWLEAGDWCVWRLVEGPAESLPRSTCQAGYKAMWSAETGYPSRAFLRAVHPRLADVVREKMPGQLRSPGQLAGTLCRSMAKKMGLPEGVAVSAATIDAHAGVPGAGVAEPGTLVMVLGTSSCHMLNAREERFVPGIAGVVQGGILPGWFGYETGQAAVGDAFDWLRRLCGAKSFAKLDEQAAAMPPGAEGARCLDWLAGCRTPLMDGSRTGVFQGVTLGHGPEHLYRALLEASAFGLRWIVELLVDGRLPVKRLVATGGLPHHNPLLVQIYADVLGRVITIAPSKQGPALGAAILGVLAAGRKATGFASAKSAISAMAHSGAGPSIRKPKIVRPNRRLKSRYDELYRQYRKMAEHHGQ